MESKKSFLETLNDHWDEEEAHRSIFIGVSETDGKRRAVFYDGKPANRYLNDNSYFHYAISERTIEEHVRNYKSIVKDIKKCLSYYEKEKKWLPLKNAPKYVT